MVKIEFASSIRRHVEAPAAEVEATTVCEALERVFVDNEALASYLLDDQGEVRKHIAVFINENTIRDRSGQSDPVSDNDTIYVIQALSGG